MMRPLASSFAGLLSLSVAPSALAAEVLPGGALDITVSGFARFLWAYGDLDARTQFRRADEGVELNGNDFRNDTEVHLIARGQHDATGIEYGATIEFEADTSRRDNTDETWIFVRGGWGELRFGDTDSAANTMKLGGYTVAVGTGGIDGTIVDVNPTVFVDFTDPSEDNTKIVYYSPIVGGLRLGLSYTPDDADDDAAGSGDMLARISDRPNDVLTGGLAYTDVIGDVGLSASIVGVVDPHDSSDTWVLYGGGTVAYAGASLAGGIGYRRTDVNNVFGSEEKAQRINDNNRFFFSLGAAYDFERFAVSVSYGYSEAKSGNAEDLRIDGLVFGLEIPLLPGLVLSSELGYLEFDRRFTFDPLTDEHANREEEERSGWVGVTRLALSF